MARWDARQLQQDIANLYLQFPELKEDDEMLRVDMLEGATNIKEFLTVVLRAIGEARVLYSGADGAIRAHYTYLDDLKARRNRFELRVSFLRAMIMKILAAADLRKIELPEATLSIKNGAAQVVGDIDPLMLPDELCRISREPDKVKIKAALLAGQVVPGFMLSNGEPSLAVHVR